MMLILPALFAAVYWAFFGFVLGDWSWPQHALTWTGEWGIFWRCAHAIAFTLGMFGSFAAGVIAHD